MLWGHSPTPGILGSRVSELTKITAVSSQLLCRHVGQEGRPWASLSCIWMGLPTCAASPALDGLQVARGRGILWCTEASAGRRQWRLAVHPSAGFTLVLLGMVQCPILAALIRVGPTSSPTRLLPPDSTCLGPRSPLSRGEEREVTCPQGALPVAPSHDRKGRGGQPRTSAAST